METSICAANHIKEEVKVIGECFKQRVKEVPACQLEQLEQVLQGVDTGIFYNLLFVRADEDSSGFWSFMQGISRSRVCSSRAIIVIAPQGNHDSLIKCQQLGVRCFINGELTRDVCKQLISSINLFSFFSIDVNRVHPERNIPLHMNSATFEQSKMVANF